jgi:uncharacterized protein YciI
VWTILIVILAGRTLNSDESSFGIVIFTAESVEAARAIMTNDPAVQAGVTHARLFRIALRSRQIERFANAKED